MNIKGMLSSKACKLIVAMAIVLTVVSSLIPTSAKAAAKDKAVKESDIKILSSSFKVKLLEPKNYTVKDDLTNAGIRIVASVKIKNKTKNTIKVYSWSKEVNDYKEEAKQSCVKVKPGKKKTLKIVVDTMVLGTLMKKKSFGAEGNKQLEALVKGKTVNFKDSIYLTAFYKLNTLDSILMYEQKDTKTSITIIDDDYFRSLTGKSYDDR